jgi:hypothetical protein
MKRDACISECGRYRYTLTRQWEAAGKLVVFCGLNPSTADALKDDATVRREVAFAKAWGFGKYVKVNAYGLRSTDPKGLWRVEDPVGPLNLDAVCTWAGLADLFVAAWGNHIRWPESSILLNRLSEMGVKVHVLKLTKQGNPHHPLRLPKVTQPFLWNGPEATEQRRTT